MITPENPSLTTTDPRCARPNPVPAASTPSPHPHPLEPHSRTTRTHPGQHPPGLPHSRPAAPVSTKASRRGGSAPPMADPPAQPSTLRSPSPHPRPSVTHRPGQPPLLCTQLSACTRGRAVSGRSPSRRPRRCRPALPSLARSRHKKRRTSAAASSPRTRQSPKSPACSHPATPGVDPAQSARTPALTRGGVPARIAAFGEHTSAVDLASRARCGRALSVHYGRPKAKARRLPTPCHCQLITRGGPCSKALGVAQNRRPRPELGDIRDSRSTCAFIDYGFCGMGNRRAGLAVWLRARGAEVRVCAPPDAQSSWPKCSLLEWGVHD